MIFSYVVVTHMCRITLRVMSCARIFLVLVFWCEGLQIMKPVAADQLRHVDACVGHMSFHHALRHPDYASTCRDEALRFASPLPRRWKNDFKTIV